MANQTENKKELRGKLRELVRSKVTATTNIEAVISSDTTAWSDHFDPDVTTPKSS